MHSSTSEPRVDAEATALGLICNFPFPGEGSRAARENEAKLQTATTRNGYSYGYLSIWYSITLLNRVRGFDWNRFRDARMKYRAVIM